MTTAMMILQSNRKSANQSKVDTTFSFCGVCGKHPCFPVTLFCQCGGVYCVTCILKMGYASSKGIVHEGVLQYIPGKVQCLSCYTVGYPTEEFIKPVANPDQECYKCPFDQCDNTGLYMDIYHHVLPTRDLNVDISCPFEMLDCPECQHLPPHPKCNRRFQRRIPDHISPRIVQYQAHVVLGGCSHICCSLCKSAGGYERALTCNFAHLRLPGKIRHLESLIHVAWVQFEGIQECINASTVLTVPIEHFLRKIQQHRQLLSPWDLPPLNIHLMTIQDKFDLMIYALSCLMEYVPYAGQLEYELDVFHGALESFLTHQTGIDCRN